MNRLTPKQEAFLTARMDVSSDAEASKRASVALNTVRKWKKESELFNTAYKSSLSITEKTRASLGVAQKSTLQGHVQELITAMPAVVLEVVRIALYAFKSSDRLAAIKLIFEATGFKADTAMPISRQNQVFVNIMNLTRPQIVAEAQKRGLPIDVDAETVYETRFNELPDMTEESVGEEEE